jgi:LPXTG-motif cell wall-anchored protein
VQATLAKSGGGAGTPAAGAGTPAAGAAASPSTAPGAAAPSQAAAATSGGTPRKLPKTASPLPVLGLAGLVSLVAGFGLSLRRRRTTR